MEDAASRDDRTEPLPDASPLGDPLPPSTAPGLGPAQALLRLVFKDRIPTGALGPSSVPASVLNPAIRMAQDQLAEHLRTCQDKRHCSVVPKPLEHYARQRPEAIGKASARDEVYRVLWADPEFPYVTRLRKAIVAKQKSLAEDLRSGALLQDERLWRTLTDLGEDGPRNLATLIWALRLDIPQGEALFRHLIPLIDSPAASNTNPTPVDAQPTQSRRDFKKVVTELKEARREASDAKRGLGEKERALQRAKVDLSSVKRDHDGLATEMELLQQQLREEEADRVVMETAAKKTTNVLKGLRREIELFREEQRAADLDRSNLSLELSTARRDIERLKLKLSSRPTGIDAVYKFVRSEQARLKRDRLIAQGGVRQELDEQWNAFRKLRKAFLNAHPEYLQARPPRRRSKDALRLVTLGGSGEIGRSCYLVELGVHRILVDCGIKPKGSEEIHPDLDRLEHLDALIITHAHADHIGWVPALVRRYPELAIYCSEGTAALLPVMLEDCRRHYVRKLTEARELAKHSREKLPIPEEYEARDIIATRNLVMACKYNSEEAISPGDITFTFYPAGHVLGAASVLIRGGGRKIFFSGDLSSFPQLTVNEAQWPEELGQVDLLVLESTYGARTHKALSDTRHELTTFLREVVNKGGSAIVACFALGRAQEVLSLISEAKRNGEIPSSVPVHVDGMIRQINPIYEKWATFKIAPGEFNEVSGAGERQEVIFTAQQRPAIIVTTSGMMNGGPVMEYARQLLPDPRHRILLTGHQDDEAPSRALRELVGSAGARRVRFTDENGDAQEFEAALPAEQISLSAHADQPGLLRYAGMMKPIAVALVHGEPEAQRALKSRLEHMYGRKGIVECGPTELDVP